MRRWTALWLALCVLLVPALASQSDKNNFVGTWHQTNAHGEPWEVELRADGTGSMRNAHQDISLTWEVTFPGPDLPPVLDIYADYGDGKMTPVDIWTYKDGVMETGDGLRFDRGEPDTVFIEPYPQAKFAPKTAFDGVWELTGGLLTSTNPPLSMEIDLAHMGLKLPVYIGIRDGRIVTSNQGATITEDPGIISYYAGNAIYAGRAEIGITGIFYYVGNDAIHLRYAGPPNEFGIDVTFTLYKTKLTDVPASQQMIENFPWSNEMLIPAAP